MNGEVTRGVEFVVRDASRPLVVLGPSLGTSVEALWADVITLITPFVDVIGWDLPGHGTSPDLEAPDAAGDVTIASLATEVAALASRCQASRGADGEPYWYAGSSAGAAVGLQLALDHAADLAGVVLAATGARIGTTTAWLERADLVEKAGTPTQIAGSSARWFVDGFIGANPEVATRLLATLQTAGQYGYASVCRALAGFDVNDRLADINVPVLAIAGDADVVTAPEALAAIAGGVSHGALAVLHGVGHQVPAEASRRVAELIEEFVRAPATVPGTRNHRLAHAQETRREVLGDAHVARATANTDAFTADFQELITRYAWGEIWGRPGLDRRTRSAVTITALVAGHHWEELPLHVRGALRNGLTRDEVREILLQCAIYCSVPTANRAFAIADAVLTEGSDLPSAGEDDLPQA